MSLWNYGVIFGFNKEEGYINLNYIFNCDLILIGLITSLESYLERNFRKIAKKTKIKDLNNEIFKNFLIEFNLKKPENNEIYLSDILPDIMYFQQKNKAKFAFKLINIYLPTIVDENQNIWNKIFGKEGYINMRHGAIHTGLIDSIIKHIDGVNVVDGDLISNAALDISKFIFNLDKTIFREFPKSEYPEFYSQKVE